MGLGRSLKKIGRKIDKQVRRTAKSVGNEIVRSGKDLVKAHALAFTAGDQLLEAAGLPSAFGANQGMVTQALGMGAQPVIPKIDMPEVPAWSTRDVGNFADVQAGGSAQSEDNQRRKRGSGDARIRTQLGLA